MTFTAIRNALQCGVKSCDYAHLIEKFISKFIGTYPEKIENLRPLLHFLDEICSDPEQAKYFENLLFYRKELAKLIEHRIWGFQFQLTTEEIREKIFAFLKSDSKCRYILHHALRFRFTSAWACGVYDAQSGIFLTLIHRISDGIARCGKDFYSYLVITDQGDIFKVDRNYIHEHKKWDFQISAEYAHFSEKIQEGIQLYWHRSKFEDTLDEQTKKELKNIGKAVTDRCQQMYDSFKVK
ncbi:MAG: hypothetical protein K2J71_06930 [Oscillospiraceae bacterium]|nr:hypothetical protein [Oscillospiraceae bacterium]